MLATSRAAAACLAARTFVAKNISTNIFAPRGAWSLLRVSPQLPCGWSAGLQKRLSSGSRSVENELDAFPLVEQLDEWEAVKKTGRLAVGEGKRYGIWRRSGRYEVVDGPRAMWLFGATVQPLGRYAAEPGDFVRVVTAEGEKRYLYGPASVWHCPVEMAQLSVHSGIKIASNEAIVVYRDAGGSVEREIVHGPAIHLPRENEWIHRFYWHGASRENSEIKVPAALTFTNLRLVPDQIYLTVPDVRTVDDALIQIKLMIFFELTDIEVMLDKTHDPIADFINGVSADVIDFAAARTFEQFKNDPELLNQLPTYQHLCNRASGIGYTVNKVVFRGYGASDTLQTMHDSAIESRTRMKLEREMAEREQSLQDYTLEKEMARAEAEGRQEEDRARIKIRLNQMEEEMRLEMKEKQEAAATKAMYERDHSKRLVNQKTLEDKSQYLARLVEMGADITEVLKAMETNPTHLIRVEGDGAHTPQLHLRAEQVQK